jgi:hypothetical protein
MYRRGNYSSGEDFVLEYGELRFTFNEFDFRERCEQAARKLGFIAGEVESDEAEDLINLVVNGEVTDPASTSGLQSTRSIAARQLPFPITAAIRWFGGAGLSSNSLGTVTNRYPRARSLAMIFGRAATVWVLFPPASCRRMIAPGRALETAERTITATPGRR